MSGVDDADAAALVEELTRKLYRSRADNGVGAVAYAESQTSSASPSPPSSFTRPPGGRRPFMPSLLDSREF